MQGGYGEEGERTAQVMGVPLAWPETSKAGYIAWLMTQPGTRKTLKEAVPKNSKSLVIATCSIMR